MLEIKSEIQRARLPRVEYRRIVPMLIPRTLFTLPYACRIVRFELSPHLRGKPLLHNLLPQFTRIPGSLPLPSPA